MYPIEFIPLPGDDKTHGVYSNNMLIAMLECVDSAWFLMTLPDTTVGGVFYKESEAIALADSLSQLKDAVSNLVEKGDFLSITDDPQIAV